MAIHQQALAQYLHDDEWYELPVPVGTTADHFERGVTLDGLRIQVDSQAFRAGRVTAMLAGLTIDLRGAKLAPDGATIDIQSAASGVDILVPANWQVDCEVETLLGGVHAPAPAAPSEAPAPRLRVTGTVVAGGLSVQYGDEQWT